MQEFTLKAYKNYLEIIKQNYNTILCFSAFIPNQINFDSYCLIRHDVDRKPLRALKMARLEKTMGIRSTYYFRVKKHTFIPEIIKEIGSCGHEIGYHYESLSDTNGNMEKALIDFEFWLNQLRKIVPIYTCSMHGRPFKPYDNRDMWRSKENHQILTRVLGLAGEAYLDIDYSDIAYIGDTGRNWQSGISNSRDHVKSNIDVEFQSSNELCAYLINAPHPKLCFQIHPERWTDNQVSWFIQLLQDKAINMIKNLLKILKIN